MKNSKELNNDEIKQMMFSIAKSLIIHYIKQNYSKKENIEEEIERINGIFDELEIDFENKEEGSGVLGRAIKDIPRVILYFKNKEEISWEEATNYIETLVHEIYHCISKEHQKGRDKIKTTFLEEGYVSYMTTKTIRYAKENIIDIPGIDKEELKIILQKQNLKNSYIHESEFVRSTQLLMEQYGIDSSYEYIFYGQDRLIEIADQISPEFGTIMRMQDKKLTHVENYDFEKEFFKKEFKKIDFSNISITIVEMNKLLQQFLIDSGEINRNPNVYELVKRYAPKGIREKQHEIKSQGESDDKIRIEMEKKLPQQDIKYENYKETSEVMQQIRQILSLYQLQPSDTRNAYAILVAYDLVEKGIEKTNNEKIEEYCKILLLDNNTRKLFFNLVVDYMDYVKIKVNEDKNIIEILNESLTNSAILVANMKEITKSEKPYWDKVNQIADLTAIQKKQNKENFGGQFYEKLLELNKIEFDEEKIYTSEDYQNFTKQMQQILDKMGMTKFFGEIAINPEMLYIKAISDNVKISSDNFSQQMINLIEIIRDCKPDLGRQTERYRKLALNINRTYQALKKSDDKEKLVAFSKDILKLYYGEGKESILQVATQEQIRGDIKHNEFVLDTINSILGMPEIYEDLSEVKQFMDKDPSFFYNLLIYNKSFKELLRANLPENISKNLEKNYMIWDFNKAVLGVEWPKIEDVKSEKLTQFAPLVQFIIKYEKYKDLLKSNPKEAEELFADLHVLNGTTVKEIAKKSDVQVCQPTAKKAFDGIEETLVKEEKENGR